MEPRKPPGTIVRPPNGTDRPIACAEGDAGSGYSHSYYHADRLGSVVALTGDSGAPVTHYTYDAYGIPYLVDPATGAQTRVAAGQPYLFTGRRFDFETGLYYYRARYYSASLGRFLQTDPIGYEDQMNLYAYVANDPVNNMDPEGKWIFRALASVAVGVVTFAANAYTQYKTNDGKVNWYKAAGAGASAAAVTAMALYTGVGLTKLAAIAAGMNFGSSVVGDIANGDDINWNGAFATAVGGAAGTLAGGGLGQLIAPRVGTVLGELGGDTVGAIFGEMTGVAITAGVEPTTEAFGNAIEAAANNIEKVGNAFGEGVKQVLDALNDPKNSGVPDDPLEEESS